MSGPQFIHFEAYGDVGAHTKNSSLRKPSMHDIVAELVRAPHACPHVGRPEKPIRRYGEDPHNVLQMAKALAEQAVDRRGYRLRCDAPIVLVGVITWPGFRQHLADNPEAMARWIAFRQDSIKWLLGYWGDRLKSVQEHVDEPHPHLHFIVLPHLDVDKRLRLSNVHPGLRAEEDAAQKNATRREQRTAHEEAMEQFQDEFYHGVASQHGLLRLGPKRQRLSRKEWKSQKLAAEALVETGRRLREQVLKREADAERKAIESKAVAQKDAEAKIDAATVEAERRVSALKSKAVHHVSTLGAKLTQMNSVLHDRDATIAAQTEEIDRLTQLLQEHGITLAPNEKF
jgi:hypothetical protein